MAVSVLETIKSRANAANTAYIAVLSLLCDTYIDLPTQYGLTGYELAQGCKAHVIDTNTDYMLDSAGTWHIYGGEIWQNVYTKSETDALLDDKQDELTTAQLAAVNSGITAAKLTADEAALAEVVDAGAKNLFDYDVLGQNSSNIGSQVVVNGVRFTMNSDKSVTITRESSSSQNAYVWFRTSDGSGALVTDFCDDAHVFSGAAGASMSTYILFINNINGSGTYKYFGDGEIIGTPQATPNAAGIYIAASYSPSNLVIKPMICTKAAWDVSQKFEQYCPSMAEMYQMILALQSN